MNIYENLRWTGWRKVLVRNSVVSRAATQCGKVVELDCRVIELEAMLERIRHAIWVASDWNEFAQICTDDSEARGGAL